MGLLDALTSGSQGGYGGLLDSLFYPSPLNQKPEYNPYANLNMGLDPSSPQVTSNPFGPVPQMVQPQAPSIWDEPKAPPPAPPMMPAPAQNIMGALPGMLAPTPDTPLNPYAQQMMALLRPQQPPVQSAAPPQVAPPTPEQNPINTMNVGGYQMPQFGSAQDYTPQVARGPQGPPTDVSAQSRQPDQPLPPAFGGTSYLERVNAGGGLIGSMLGDTTQQKNLTAQYQAIRQGLITNGESPQAAASKAMVAVMNPEAAKTIIPELFTSKEKYQKTGVDGLGNETYGFVNERDQTINGKAIGAEGGQSGGGGFLAPGVKSIDSSLTGQDYLKQFSTEVQAAVQNYVDGKSMPTGNPRKGFTQTVKMIAQKYGADTGQTVDDTTYGARRTMRNQLSSSAPSSLGGQINIGNTAAGHLADLTQKAIELGNVDTGIAPLTSAVNSVRGLGTEQAAKMEALKGAAQHYGQEITKFYAGSPGGVAERDRFIESVNGARSPKELAAILATEAELMRSRLDALGGQIKGVLGEEGLKQYPVLRPDGEAALAKVEQNVSRLKGGQATAGFSEGQTATNPKTGQTLTYRNGKWQ